MKTAACLHLICSWGFATGGLELGRTFATAPVGVGWGSREAMPSVPAGKASGYSPVSCRPEWEERHS